MATTVGLYLLIGEKKTTVRFVGEGFIRESAVVREEGGAHRLWHVDLKAGDAKTERDSCQSLKGGLNRGQSG